MKKAYIFPGQGSQFSGIGKDLYESKPEAKKLFESANDKLGFRITDTMFSGTDEELKQTKITQPAIFLHSVIKAFSLGENLKIQLYPNPTGTGSEGVLSIEGNSKSRNILVYNTLGSKVSSHRIEKGETRIVLEAPSPGIYFIEVEGAGKQIKWVVE